MCAVQGYKSSFTVEAQMHIDDLNQYMMVILPGVSDDREVYTPFDMVSGVSERLVSALIQVQVRYHMARALSLSHTHTQ